MCSCEDGDPPEFFTEAKRRARKEHRCDECYRPIAVGDRYQRVSGKWDGTIESFAICIPCQQYRAAFHVVEGCSPPLGAAREEARNCADGMPEFVKDFRDALRAIRRKAGNVRRRAA